MLQYLGSIQLNPFALMILKAGMAPATLDLSLIERSCVVDLHGDDGYRGRE